MNKVKETFSPEIKRMFSLLFLLFFFFLSDGRGGRKVEMRLEMTLGEQKDDRWENVNVSDGSWGIDTFFVK